MKTKKKKQKKVKKTSSVKTPSSRPINIEIFPVNRMEAITNLSQAILETAKALNTPSVAIKNSTFLGGNPAINISQKEKK